MGEYIPFADQPMRGPAPQPTAPKPQTNHQRFTEALDRRCAADLGLPYEAGRVRHMKTRRVREWVFNELIGDEMVQSIHLMALRTISQALGNPFKDGGGSVLELADMAALAIERGRKAGV